MGTRRPARLGRGRPKLPLSVIVVPHYRSGRSRFRAASRRCEHCQGRLPAGTTCPTAPLLPARAPGRPARAPGGRRDGTFGTPTHPRSLPSGLQGRGAVIGTSVLDARDLAKSRFGGDRGATRRNVGSRRRQFRTRPRLRRPGRAARQATPDGFRVAPPSQSDDAASTTLRRARRQGQSRGA